MNSVRWGSRPATLRTPRAGRNLLIALGAAVAILTISQTGSANSSYALWNSSATVDAGSITTGSILAEVDIAGLSGAYTSGQLAQSGAVSISNNGTVSADYTTNFGWSAVSAMTAAISTLIWKTASPANCSSAAPVGATVLSGTGPTGSLAAGATDVYCLSTTLKPSGVPSGSAASATFDVDLRLAGWSSAASASIAQTFSDTAGPSRPTLSSSGITSASAVIAWSPSTDDVGVAGYDLYRGTQKVASLSSSDASYTDIGLSGTTTYSYTMVARDAAGNASAASNPLAVTTLPTPDTQAPSVPNNLMASGTTTTGTTISWMASTDNVAVTGYDVFRDGTYVQTVPTQTFTDTNLSANTSYSYTVKARDAAGNQSAASVALPVTTLLPPDTQAPTAPTGLAAKNTTTTRTDLSWTLATDNVGVVAYAIYRDNVKLTTVTTLTYTDATLVAGTSYSYTVTAIDAAGNESVASNPVSVTTLAPADTQAPTKPTSLVASNTTATGTTISWGASTDNVAVVDYRVFRDGALVGTVTAPTTSFTDSGLTSATTYNYTVQARDAAGNVSLASAVLSVRTSGPALMCLPQNGQNGKVDFLWTVGENPADYALYVNNKAVIGFTVSGSPLVFTLSKQNLPDGITPGTLTVELRKTLPGGGVWIAGTATVELSADGKKLTPATCG